MIAGFARSVLTARLPNDTSWRFATRAGGETPTSQQLTVNVREGELSTSSTERIKRYPLPDKNSRATIRDLDSNPGSSICWVATGEGEDQLRRSRIALWVSRSISPAESESIGLSVSPGMGIFFSRT